jgi:galacturan 1,4-alpha-galacturonidase
MIFPAVLALTGLLATSASAIVSPYTGKTTLTRPNIQAWPKSPGTPRKVSPARDETRYCFVKPSCSSNGDSAKSILAAFQKCNKGGTVVLDAHYVVGSPLDLTFLEEVDVVLTGNLTFSGNITYWMDHTFKYAYQTSSSYFRIGGRDVNIYGGGVGLLNGNGQPWWDAFAANSSLLRPILFVVDGLQGGSISGINMINPPNVRTRCPRGLQAACLAQY